MLSSWRVVDCRRATVHLDGLRIHFPQTLGTSPGVGPGMLYFYCAVNVVISIYGALHMRSNPLSTNNADC